MEKGGQEFVIIAAGMYVETPPFQLSSKQAEIFHYLKDSSEVHRYDHIRQLLFELILRENMIDSAIALNESEVEFQYFKLPSLTTCTGGRHQEVTCLGPMYCLQWP
jgi:hypothetical protein